MGSMLPVEQPRAFWPGAFCCLEVERVTRTLTRSQREIQDALDTLRAHRAIAERNPTTKNKEIVAACEKALDDLLDVQRSN